MSLGDSMAWPASTLKTRPCGAPVTSSSFLLAGRWPTPAYDSYLVDSASSHMLVSKIKPCMSKYKQLYSETANGSLNQLSVYLIVPYYLDNRGNSRANTC
jgi:hypothetical protein